MLKTVTITGADDSVDPAQLAALSNKYLFVEWAILFSSKRTGTNRYPSTKWIDELYELVSGNPMSLSAHLCGDFAKELLAGNCEFIEHYSVKYNRLQINHNFKNNPVNLDILHAIIETYPGIDFILQLNKNNADVCHEMAQPGYKNLNFLWDASGGRGTVATTLGCPMKRHLTGYAGGIGPDNIVSQIQAVEKVVGDLPTWIDMETKVRSNDDSLFDLGKVNFCLLNAGQYVKFDD